MKLSAKVKNPESTLVEITIEWTMEDWNKLVPSLDYLGSQGKLRDQITSMYRSMLKVVEGEVPAEEGDDANPKNS